MNANHLKRVGLAAATLGLLMLANAASAVDSSQPPLAPFQLTPERRQLIGIKLATVEEKNVADEIATTGNVEPDEQREAYVQTRFAGWIEKVFANQTWQFVKKGDPLFTIYSPDLVTTEQEYLLARRGAQRIRRSSIDDVAEGADSMVGAAAERLKLWGVATREIERLKKTGKIRNAVEIDAPISGYVVELNAKPNMYAQPETLLFTITDLSRIWVYAAVFQDEIGKVKVGDSAQVTVDSYPGDNFDGQVDFIWPQIDPTTRTARVRCELANPGERLRPGMFARVTLKTDLGRRLVIPQDGVLRTGTHNVVFIDRGDGYLTPSEVELGPRAGDEMVVLKGLKAGDRIVSSANFLIDSESQLEAAAGNFAPPPPGVSAAASQPGAPMPTVSIELTTDPNPPVRGHNKLRVMLRDPSGKPVTGANVSITFYMAAMPAMGMAAMRAQASAIDQGSGSYTAQIDLQSGGTWQVTIAATKNGATIGSKQYNVSVSGPMAM